MASCLSPERVLTKSRYWISLSVNERAKIKYAISTSSIANGSLINYNIAILDSWDVLAKPCSRVIIALEDEDQEFVDGWVPDSYVEGEGNDKDMDGPLCSDVLMMGLDREQEERNRKDGA